ncbi:MAG: ABC transporter permease subunit [Myxococcota bacterium]
MTNVLAIARRELGAYFDSPLAYFVVPVYVVLVGGFALWFDDLFAGGTVSLRGVFFWAAVFLVLLVPAITMRLFAEERRTGSLEILVTLPITEGELVFGKYLAAMSLVAVAVSTTIPYAFTMAWLGTPAIADADAPPMIVRVFTETGLDFGPALCGYLGLLLLGGALAAIGTAASSLTSNQIVAFLLALVVGMFPYAMGFFLERVPNTILPLVQYLAFETHFNNLARGVIDTRNLLFWGSVAAASLHLAVFSLERRRLS